MQEEAIKLHSVSQRTKRFERIKGLERCGYHAHFSGWLLIFTNIPGVSGE